jgi:hypothetical protein
MSTSFKAKLIPTISISAGRKIFALDYPGTTLDRSGTHQNGTVEAQNIHSAFRIESRHSPRKLPEIGLRQSIYQKTTLRFRASKRRSTGGARHARGFKSRRCGIIPRLQNFAGNSENLLVRLWESASELFRRPCLLPLFLDGRPQFDLVGIIRGRRATRQQDSTGERDEKQDGPHAEDHATRQPNFNHKPMFSLTQPKDSFSIPRGRSIRFLRCQSEPDSGVYREGRAASHRHIRSEAPG